MPAHRAPDRRKRPLTAIRAAGNSGIKEIFLSNPTGSTVGAGQPGRGLPANHVAVICRPTFQSVVNDFGFTSLTTPNRCGTVADATLHRRHGSPLRMVGRIKWLIDPAYRGVGLGTTLVNDFIRIAREGGLRHLTCMLISDLEADAVATLRDLGFEGTTIPGYGTDPDGNQHDMIKMVLKL